MVTEINNVYSACKSVQVVFFEHKSGCNFIRGCIIYRKSKTRESDLRKTNRVIAIRMISSISELENLVKPIDITKA